MLPCTYQDLAIPPNVFGETVHTLEEIPNAVVPGKTRFVIEKPFGRDTNSCKALLDGFQGLGEEMQYRLDHYLAVRNYAGAEQMVFFPPIFLSCSC